MISVEQTVYNSSVVGSYPVVFRYNWSVDATRDVTISLNLSDDCVSKLAPLSSPISFDYTLMVDGSKTIPLDPVIESGYEYCTFSVAY